MKTFQDWQDLFEAIGREATGQFSANAGDQTGVASPGAGRMGGGTASGLGAAMAAYTFAAANSMRLGILAQGGGRDAARAAMLGGTRAAEGVKGFMPPVGKALKGVPKGGKPTGGVDKKNQTKGVTPKKGFSSWITKKTETAVNSVLAKKKGAK